ncbi:MAG: cell division protein FtsQ/DivIB [Devosia sp.]
MQQVAARAFADAQLVDPRQLPVPLKHLGKQTRFGLARAWILHRKAILRGAAAGVVLAGALGAYQARDAIGAGATALAGVAQGQVVRAGFGVGKINITGQVLTREGSVLNALAITPDMSTLNFDAEAALQRILDIPSIKSANIRKVYPDKLEVSIVEREPMARWRIGDKTWLVDEDGHPIIADDGSFRSLPLVVGEGAADDAKVMVRALDRYPAITEDLAALSRIGERRWDLIFYSGLRVELPEIGVAQALAALDQDQRDGQLLDRDVTVIDMRVPGMVSLKLGDLAAKAWADEKKKTKRVTKGDAEYETATERAAESKPQ